jgi:hypothetical protein
MPIKNPSERAAARAYRRAWLGRSLHATWEWERRYGIFVGAGLGIAALIAQAIQEHSLSVLFGGSFILAGVVIVLLITFFVYLWITPPRLAWEAAHPDDPETLTYLSVGSLDATCKEALQEQMTFPTRGTHNVEMKVHDFFGQRRLQALRLLRPDYSDDPVRIGDPLPRVFRIGRVRRGRLVLQQITPAYVLFRVEGSHGFIVVAELYFEDQGH